MRIAATGFVCEQAGSIATANALLLRALLKKGVEIDFFSKPSFVDPRPAVGSHDAFRFFSTVNYLADRFRSTVERLPVLGFVAGRYDAFTYNKMLVHKMSAMHRERKYNLCLWFGTYARGRIPGIPHASFVQGPPGTDARSVIRMYTEIRNCAGNLLALRWKVMAFLRLSRLGLPPFHYTDHFIVGSSQSKKTLERLYGILPQRVSAMPYPIDLELFHPPSEIRVSTPELRILWLGRIIPRKRLDLFLDGAKLAIDGGLNISVNIVGGIGFIHGYEKLIEAFPHAKRIKWNKFIPRRDVPGFMTEHDVLVQPSDEEDFGSSVAEAQACGLPVIVGRTNGNADYLSPKDIHLADDHPETLAAALAEMALRKKEGKLGDAAESRIAAEKNFETNRVVEQLIKILTNVSHNHSHLPSASIS